MQNQEFVKQIVGAYVGNNKVTAEELPGVVRDVHNMLVGLVAEKALVGKPAVSIKKSVTNEYIVCLECGKHLKIIKRHLRDCHNTNPDDYKEKWQLPSTYPLVASDYAQRRAVLALEIGLGRGKKKKKADCDLEWNPPFEIKTNKRGIIPASPGDDI